MSPANPPVPFDPWLKVHRLSRRRTAQPWTHRLEDIYTQVFSVAVAVTVAASVVRFSQATFAGTAHLFQPILDTDGGIPAWCALGISGVAGVGLMLWMLLSTGPVGASRAELIWGFQLPVDRRPFLRRRLRSALGRASLLSACAAAGATVIAWAAVGPSWNWVPLMVVLLSAGPVIAALAVRAQGHPHDQSLGPVSEDGGLRSRLPWVVASVLMLGAVAGATWLWLPGTGPALQIAELGPVSTGVAVLLASATAVGTIRRAIPSVESLGWKDLASGGGRSDVAQAARLSLDVQEIYRSLMHPAGIRSGGWLVPGTAQRAGVALARAEVLTWIRLSGPLPLWGSTAAAAVLYVAVPAWSAPLLVSAVVTVLMLVAGDLAASSARVTALNPHVEDVLPVSRRSARLIRTLVPCAVMALWGTMVFGFLGVLWQQPELMLLGALAAFGVGATSTAGARRPPVDWAGATVMTDAGPVPIGVASQIAGAHMAAVAVCVPVLAALLSSGPVMLLLGLQLLHTLVGLGWSLVKQRRTA